MPPGTGLYIAPEVLRQEKYGWKADFYSFGVLIWLILTGGLIDTGLPPSSENLTDNWRRLSDCIEDPAQHSAGPLPTASARDLVLQLAQPDADLRPSHECIRDHLFIQPLELPVLGASVDVVNAWLESQAISRSPSE